MDIPVTYRLATTADVPAIAAFADYWLAGRGMVDKTPGSAHDYFIPLGRHFKFVTKYVTLLALTNDFIIGWSVKTNKQVLIHLLVAGNFRHRGIGSQLLKQLSPELVRSKTDQAAGDPAKFYANHGYTPANLPHQGKKHNVQIFTPEKLSSKRGDPHHTEAGEATGGGEDV